MKHRYLVTLEIVPLEVGKTYIELPSHLTLMSRFFSNLEPAELASVLEPLFVRSKPVHLVFGKNTELGPKKLTVHTIEHSAVLNDLHHELSTLLDSIHVGYEYPQFVGKNHKPHVTRREEQTFSTGDPLVAEHCYLIEIIDGQRLIRSRSRLSA